MEVSLFWLPYAGKFPENYVGISGIYPLLFLFAIVRYTGISSKHMFRDFVRGQRKTNRYRVILPSFPTSDPLLVPSKSNNQSWATSLPPDVGYDELVDIRTVVVPWPKTCVGREGQFDFVDGFVRRRQGDPSGERGSRVGNREFDSDEASLWWYAYARPEGAHTAELPEEVSPVKSSPCAR